MRLAHDARVLLLARLLARLLAVDGSSDGSGKKSWNPWHFNIAIQRTNIGKLFPRAPLSSRRGQPLQLRWATHKRKQHDERRDDEQRDDKHSDDEHNDAKSANPDDACVSAGIFALCWVGLPKRTDCLLSSLRDTHNLVAHLGVAFPSPGPACSGLGLPSSLNPWAHQHRRPGRPAILGASEADFIVALAAPAARHAAATPKTKHLYPIHRGPHREAANRSSLPVSPRYSGDHHVVR